MDRVSQVSRQLLCDCQEHWEDHVPPASRICEFPACSELMWQDVSLQVFRTHGHSPRLCFCEQRVNPKTGEVSGTPVGMMDVYQEFNELSEKFKIMKYKSKVSVNICWGLTIWDTNVIPAFFLLLESGEELRFWDSRRSQSLRVPGSQIFRELAGTNILCACAIEVKNIVLCRLSFLHCLQTWRPQRFLTYLGPTPPFWSTCSSAGRLKARVGSTSRRHVRKCCSVFLYIFL